MLLQATGGQFCYINPKYETVVAMFSTLLPLAPDADFKTTFTRACRKEHGKWHLCHQLAETVNQRPPALPEIFWQGII
jgi:hypothetical protein